MASILYKTKPPLWIGRRFFGLFAVHKLFCSGFCFGVGFIGGICIGFRMVVSSQVILDIFCRIAQIRQHILSSLTDIIHHIAYIRDDMVTNSLGCGICLAAAVCFAAAAR